MPKLGPFMYSSVMASGWTQQAYIKASNTGIDDHFGISLALSGNTLAVGAEGEESKATGINGDQNDNNASNAGAVYVFTRSGTQWSQQAYIKASNTNIDDHFGISLALSGNTLAVGAEGEDSEATGINGDQNDNNASNAGAVYVFTRSGIQWSQQAYVKASNGGGEDKFGYAVALAGDTLAVGAYGESSAASGIGGNQDDDSASNAGAVYVFVRGGSAWTQQAYIKSSNPGMTDVFGWSLALFEDTLAVGAPFEASSATGIDGDQNNDNVMYSGAVYVFTRNGAAWSQQAYVKASNSGLNDTFGWSVALSDDALAAGAKGEASMATGINGNQDDDSQANAGAVYLFTRKDTAWSQQDYIKPAVIDRRGLVWLQRRPVR